MGSPGAAGGGTAREPSEELEGARYRSLVQTSWVPIVQSDPSGRILEWNEGAERLFGYTAEEATGELLTLLMSERYREQHLEGLQRYLDTGETRVIGETVELHGLRKDGTEFPIELTLDTFTLQGHRYFTGIIRDITTRKQAQAELERHARRLKESNESWEEFGHAVSHDLKEPLRTIAGNVGLVERRHGDELDEDARELLAFVTEAAHRMDGLLEGLLRYARVGEQGEPTVTVDLNKLLEEVGQDLAAQRIDHDAQLEVDELPDVTGDRDQVRQLLQNLVSNAFKHGGRSPNVRVYAEPAQRNDAVVVCVEDDGVGIPSEDQDDIFGMFRRGPGADETEGTGVGLAICQRIAHRHGGEIWIESEPGQGSTFKVRLLRARLNPW